MSLIKCPECGKEFSDKAAACPNCGCPAEVVLSEIQKQQTFKPQCNTNIPDEIKSKVRDGNSLLRTLLITTALSIVIALVAYSLTASTSEKSITEQAKSNNAVAAQEPVKEFNTEEYAKSLVEAEKQKAATVKQLKYNIHELRKQLRSKVDSVENITWYYDKTSPKYISGNVIYCYMGESGGQYWLRVIYGFSKDDWIFMDSIVFNIDGWITRKVVRYNERNTDVNDGIFEWVDWKVLPVDEDFLLAIANSKSTQIKFSGNDGAKSFTVSKQQKKALKNIITYYRLREKLNEVSK